MSNMRQGQNVMLALILIVVVIIILAGLYMSKAQAGEECDTPFILILMETTTDEVDMYDLRAYHPEDPNASFLWQIKERYSPEVFQAALQEYRLKAAEKFALHHYEAEGVLLEIQNLHGDIWTYEHPHAKEPQNE